uniref:Uncharacterized protein n=1 Tax=uncultured prokaryote TaxID=198431 RepID=A0A0H5Q3K1_9ZZZZ|nr:hypothetical protein [uncultured prokaryote]
MPPLPSVPGVIKVIVSTSRSDTPVENIMHIGYTGALPDSATLTAFMATFNPYLADLYNAEGSTDLTGVQVEMIDLSSDTGATAVAVLTATGVRTGDFAPSSAAVVCSWTIDRRYRGGHPRTYFPFGTAGTYEAGSAKLWDTGFIADVQTLVTTFISSWAGTTTSGTTWVGLVNVSYIDKNTNPTPPYRRVTPIVDAITGWTVKQRICSQRRRLGKVLG